MPIGHLRRSSVAIKTEKVFAMLVESGLMKRERCKFAGTDRSSKIGSKKVKSSLGEIMITCLDASHFRRVHQMIQLVFSTVARPDDPSYLLNADDRFPRPDTQTETDYPSPFQMAYVTVRGRAGYCPSRIESSNDTAHSMGCMGGGAVVGLLRLSVADTRRHAIGFPAMTTRLCIISRLYLTAGKRSRMRNEDGVYIIPFVW